MNSSDMRRTWNGINSILSKNDRSCVEPTKLEVNGATLQNPFDIANAFNQHFVNIGPELASSIPSPNTDFRNYVKQTNSTFELTQLSQSEIFEINNLHINKASGLDTIPANLLKYSANYVSKSLTHIFNLSIDTGILPFDWKNARVSPIFKDDSKTDPTNYRPISVLPVTIKVLERAINNQVYNYLIRINILAKF